MGTKIFVNEATITTNMITTNINITITINNIINTNIIINNLIETKWARRGRPNSDLCD